MGTRRHHPRFNTGVFGAEVKNMRARFWIGLSAVFLIAIGAVAAALIVHSDDKADFETLQQEEAIRAAHQAEAVKEWGRISREQGLKAALEFRDSKFGDGRASPQYVARRERDTAATSGS